MKIFNGLFIDNIIMLMAELEGKIVEASKDLLHSSKLPSNQIYLCRNPDCTKRELILRKGNIKRPHFAHKHANPECTNQFEGETPEHLEMKHFMKELLQITDENVEVYGYEGVRPDLLWEYAEKKYAIEVQHSPITKEEIQRRNTCYKTHDLIPLWIFHYEKYKGDFSSKFMKSLDKLKNFMTLLSYRIQQVFYLALNSEPRLIEFFSFQGNDKKYSMASSEDLYQHITQPEIQLQFFLNQRRNWDVFQFLHELLEAAAQSPKQYIHNLVEFPLEFDHSVPDFLWTNKNNRKYVFQIKILQDQIKKKQSPQEFKENEITPILVWRTNQEISKWIKINENLAYFFQFSHLKLYLHIKFQDHRKSEELTNYSQVERVVDSPKLIINNILKNNKDKEQILSCEGCIHLSNNSMCEILKFHIHHDAVQIDDFFYEFKGGTVQYFEKPFFGKNDQNRVHKSIVILRGKNLTEELQQKLKFRDLRGRKVGFIYCDLLLKKIMQQPPNQNKCQWCDKTKELITESEFYLRNDSSLSVVLKYPRFLCKKCFIKFSNYQVLCSLCKMAYHKPKFTMCYSCDQEMRENQGLNYPKRWKNIGTAKEKKNDTQNKPQTKQKQGPAKPQYKDDIDYEMIQESNGTRTLRGSVKKSLDPKKED